jgi:hypothetical protein
LSKATNYQKQELRVFDIKFSKNISFEHAKKLLIEFKTLKEAEENKDSFSHNMEGSNWFSRWNED